VSPSPDRKIELLPIEDRKREQIAAQHWLLATVSKVPPEEPKEIPAYLSAAEAIGLIGFGRVRALDGPLPGAPSMYDRWGVHVTGASPYERQYPLVRRMRLVLARVHWWTLQRRKKAGLAKCPISALREDDRAEVRWAIRKHGMSAAQTIALLRTDVRKLLAVTSAIDQAIDRLRTDIAAERLVAWGRPGDYRKGTLRGMHDRILPQFFANRHATILRTGWATCDPKAPHFERKNWSGPDWGDVKFRREEILSLYESGGSQLKVDPDTSPLENQISSSQCRPAWSTTEVGSDGTRAPGRTRLAVPNKPGGGGRKKAQATAAMIDAVEQGRITFQRLQSMRQKELPRLYPEAGRTLLTKCREAALRELTAHGFPTKADISPTNDK
jgi:hypothetical protein